MTPSGWVLRRAEGVASSSSSSSSRWWRSGELVRMRRAMSKRAFLRIDAALLSSSHLHRENTASGWCRAATKATSCRGILRASTRQHQQRRVLTAAASGVSPGKKHGDLPKNFEHTDVEAITIRVVQHVVPGLGEADLGLMIFVCPKSKGKSPNH